MVNAFAIITIIVVAAFIEEVSFTTIFIKLGFAIIQDSIHFVQLALAFTLLRKDFIKMLAIMPS